VISTIFISDGLRPIFLCEDYYVPAPLESTYQQAWAVFPALLKELMLGSADSET
jgi:hypothetical protein